ncbi:MAG: hypothetical protein ACRDBG_00820 [Waterburya sp.]
MKTKGFHNANAHHYITMNFTRSGALWSEHRNGEDIPISYANFEGRFVRLDTTQAERGYHCKLVLEHDKELYLFSYFLAGFSKKTGLSKYHSTFQELNPNDIVSFWIRHESDGDYVKLSVMVNSKFISWDELE